MNKSGIHPIEYKVLIKADEFGQVTEGGVWLPDDEVARQDGAMTRGTVIETSPWAFDFLSDNEDGLAGVGAGDSVLFAKYAGQTVDGKDGEKYRLVNDKDIIAILDK